MQPLKFMHPLQVKQSVAKDGVLEEDLVEFTQFEQANLVVHLRFYVPVLLHCR